MSEQKPTADFMMNLLDPRSPTMGINRTPIVNGMDTDKMEDVHDHLNQPEIKTDIEKMDTSLVSDTEEDYFTVSESSTSSESDEQIADLSAVSAHSEIEDSEIEDSDVAVSPSIETKETKVNEVFNDRCSIEKMSAPVYYRPRTMLNRVLTTPKSGRPPLESVSNLMLPSTPPSRYAIDSPQYILRKKQWKRITDEKQKLGINDENALPPFSDVTSSAPGKLIKRNGFAIQGGN